MPMALREAEAPVCEHPIPIGGHPSQPLFRGFREAGRPGHPPCRTAYFRARLLWDGTWDKKRTGGGGASLHSLVFQPCFQIRFLYVLFPFPETGANFSIDGFEWNERETEWKSSLPDHLVFGIRVVGARAEGCIRQPLYEADVRSDIKEERSRQRRCRLER